jgi:hypothetical protein
VVSMKHAVLKELMAHSSRKKTGAAQKAKALYQATKESIGVKRIGRHADLKVLRASVQCTLWFNEPH